MTPTTGPGVNEEFVAKVRSAPRPRPPAPGGKGSPVALLSIGAVGTGTLAACAAALGGGLLDAPAAIPLVTVVAVLTAGRRSRRTLRRRP